jgi:N utilization substance protein B
MKRREAREAAFLLIFEKAFHTEPVGELIETAVVCRALQLDEYSNRLLGLWEQNMTAIDARIEPFLTKWKLSRLPKVTLAVLRLAVCELDFFPDIPVRVTINEAVELAKNYGTEEDASYVNGVLGSYVKAARPVKQDAGDIKPCADI